jgi:hypothetical protein
MMQLRVVELFDGAHAAVPGIVEDDVDASETLGGEACGVTRRGGVRDVEPHRDRAIAVRRYELVARSRVDVG